MHESHKDPEETEIKIVDRRRFTPVGDTRADAPAEQHRKPATPVQAAPGPGKDHSKKVGTTDSANTTEPKSTVDFINFIASLATQAMTYLGVLPEAQSRGIPVNPEIAREYIEILGMLQERTQGNLNPEEERTLQRILAELRLQYVHATSPIKAPR